MYAGLFSQLDTVNDIFVLSGMIAPSHFLGRNDDIGVRARVFESSGSIAPPAEKLYAVEPAGVDNNAPSHIKSSTLFYY